MASGENWFISGNLATLNAQFDEYMYKGVDIADQQEMTNAPDFSGALNVEYKQPLDGGGQLSYRVGYSYQSDVVATTEITKDPITNAVTVPITCRTAMDWSAPASSGPPASPGRCRCRAATWPMRST